MGCKFCGEWMDTSRPQTTMCKKCARVYKEGYQVGYVKAMRKYER